MKIYREPKLSRRKQESILTGFALDHTASSVAIEYKINRNTVNKYYNYIRERIYKLYSKAPRFSGEVEVDQALFGRGAKKVTSDKRFMLNRDTYGDPTYFKRKKKKGKKVNMRRTLVFGILRRGGDVYTHIIEKADRDTLLPIIHLVVDPKATIYSDAWPAYNELKIEGYKHGVINHSNGYISMKGAHTGGIDSFWGHSKARLKKFNGVTARTFPLHLKECEFRWNTRPSSFKDLKNKSSSDEGFKRRMMILKRIVNF